MMRVLAGALAGYVFFAFTGAVLLYGLLSYIGPEHLLKPGQPAIAEIWLVVSLFLTGWLAGMAGKIATKVADESASAILLGILVAVSGFAILPFGGPAGLELADIERMSRFQWLAHTHMPDWYASTLPLFAAAFVGYGGLKSRRY